MFSPDLKLNLVQNHNLSLELPEHPPPFPLIHRPYLLQLHICIISMLLSAFTAYCTCYWTAPLKHRWRKALKTSAHCQVVRTDSDVQVTVCVYPVFLVTHCHIKLLPLIYKHQSFLVGTWGHSVHTSACTPVFFPAHPATLKLWAFSVSEATRDCFVSSPSSPGFHRMRRLVFLPRCVTDMEILSIKYLWICFCDSATLCLKVGSQSESCLLLLPQQKGWKSADD